MLTRNLLGLLAIAVTALSCKPEHGTIHGSVFIATRGGESYKLALVEVGAFPDSVLKAVVDRRRVEAQPLHDSLQPRVAQLAVAMREAEREYRKTVDMFSTAMGRAIWANLVETYSLGERMSREQVLERDRRQAVVARERWSAANDTLARILNGRFLLDSLPAPFATVKTDADGRFVLSVPPGRTGLVALAKREVGEVTEIYHWLVWVDIAPGDSSVVMLSNDNLFETRCRTCYVGVSPAEK